MKTKLLFLINSLAGGGAEKALVNLVNNMNHGKYDITVIALFGGGVNEALLKEHIKYKTIFKKPFRGNVHFFKILSPSVLHHLIIKDKYDVEIAYLEGICTRIISGCMEPKTRRIFWFHSTPKSLKSITYCFRNLKEAIWCYNSFDAAAFVSNDIKKTFLNFMAIDVPCCIIHNTLETDLIQKLSLADPPNLIKEFQGICIISCGRLVKVKAFDRLIKVQKRLLEEGLNTSIYILGDGEEKTSLSNLARSLGIDTTVHFVGYQDNPYKYIRNCDIYVCCSISEGLSTAVTEALIVGTPVVTTDVSGMRELLGDHNQYGIITDNSEEGIYCGIKQLISNPQMKDKYHFQSLERGKMFYKAKTVYSVEQTIDKLVNTNGIAPI